jgi:hypothetical protein
MAYAIDEFGPREMTHIDRVLIPPERNFLG